MKKWQGLLLSLGVSAAALYLALRDIRLGDVARVLGSANYIWVLPTAAGSIAGLLARAVRWRALLGGHIPLERSFSILNISYILNNILPARLGEVARAFLAARITPPIPVFTSLSTILAERIIDMLTVLVLLGGVLLALPDTPPVVGGMGVLMGGAALIIFAALLIFARRPGWAHALLRPVLRIFPPLERFGPEGILDRVLDGLQPLAAWRSLLNVVLWTAIAWALSIFAGYLLMFSMFDHPRLDAVVLFVALASLAIAVPATLASVGPFEGAVIIALLAVYGVELSALPGTLVIPPLAQDPAALAAEEALRATAFSFALVLHVVNVCTYAVMGAVGLVQEGISLGQVTRGARDISDTPPID